MGESFEARLVKYSSKETFKKAKHILHANELLCCHETAAKTLRAIFRDAKGIVTRVEVTGFPHGPYSCACTSCTDVSTGLCPHGLAACLYHAKYTIKHKDAAKVKDTPAQYAGLKFSGMPELLKQVLAPQKAAVIITAESDFPHVPSKWERTLFSVALKMNGRDYIGNLNNLRQLHFGKNLAASLQLDAFPLQDRQIIRFLKTQGVKAIVIACNTASACALETVKQELDIPIIGVIYAGARTAAEATHNGKIGVIGTEATIRSGIYTREMQKLRPDIEVIGKPCPLFVPLVEEGLFHDSVTDEIASRYLSSLKEKYIDTLVMGCTHYPLLRSTLHRLMGDEVTLVNPAYETAVELKTLLRDMDLTRSSEDLERFSEENSRRAAAGEPILDPYQFFVSDRAENFTRFAKAILPKEVKDTKQINIEEY